MKQRQRFWILKVILTHCVVFLYLYLLILNYSKRLNKNMYLFGRINTFHIQNKYRIKFFLCDLYKWIKEKTNKQQNKTKQNKKQHLSVVRVKYTSTIKCPTPSKSKSFTIGHHAGKQEICFSAINQNEIKKNQPLSVGLATPPDAPSQTGHGCGPIFFKGTRHISIFYCLGSL